MSRKEYLEILKLETVSLEKMLVKTKNVNHGTTSDIAKKIGTQGFKSAKGIMF